MNIQIRAYQSKDVASAAQIWNEVVTDGNAFPQDTEMTANVANLFFQEQTYTFHTFILPSFQKSEIGFFSFNYNPISD